MNNILRILVPIDFSAESERALDWARMVAKQKAGATIYLMHVFPLAGKPMQLAMASVAYAMEMAEVKQKMKQWLAKLATDVLGFPIYENGRIPDAVARVCEDKKIDLVVMTTRGRRGLHFILPGSVTEETVRVAPCPVMVLHLNDRVQKAAETVRG